MNKNKARRTKIVRGVVAATLTGLPMAGAFTIAGPGIVALAEEGAFTIEGGESYGTLLDAIDAVPDGGTIKVNQDINNAPGIRVTSGKNFTIDFQNHTYTANKPGEGSAGTETIAFQLLKDSTITMKNGTLRISEDNLTPAERNIKRIIQNYANLTLENMVIDATNQFGGTGYPISFNNGNSVIRDSKVVGVDDGEIAFDVCRYSTSYPSVSVTVSGNSEINGNIELYASDSNPMDGLNLTIEDGTINGSVVMDPTVANITPSANGGKDLVDKNPSVTVAAPEGYEWSNRDSDGKIELVKKVPEDATEETLGGHSGLKVNGTDESYGYKIYQVFTASVVDPGNAESTATDIAWTDNAAVKNAVLGVLHAADPAFEGDNSQAAAEYINEHIGDVNESDSLADKLARALADIAPETTVKSGKVTNLDQAGFYLIVTDPASVPDGFVGTSPIWLPWKAEADTITEVTPKEATATLTKTVSENGTDFVAIDDLAKGEEVTFKLSTKLPDNYGAFETYKLVFADTMPTGMSDPTGYEVKVGSTTVATDKYAVESGKITIDDLKTACPAAKGGDELTITYKAKLDNPSATGKSGQYENAATMEYPNDPVDPTKTNTVESKASVITYKMVITKIDKGTNKPLAGAKFVVKQGNKYLKADGTLTDAPASTDDESLAANADLALTTGNEGTFAVSFIDSGSDYIIHEVSAPTGYEKMDDVTISFSHDGALDAANAKIDVTTSGTAVVTDATSADLGSGEVKVTISNTKEITLPITGMTPNQLATSVGMILVVAGSAMLAIHVSRSRKGAESK